MASAANSPARPGPARHPGPARWIAVGAAVSFLALALAVHAGWLDAFDAAVRRHARPDDVWGTVQWRADVVVEGLRPPMLALPLLLFTVALCLLRRSLRPALLVIAVVVLAAAVALGTKYALARPDPHATNFGHGGSFPSGHTLALVVCSGVVVLLTRPWTRRLWLVPALLGCLMGACLIVQAAHWTTDVLGGGLLAVAVLAGARATGFSGWAVDAHVPRASLEEPSQHHPGGADGAAALRGTP